jgi:SAM-dependent methyltransferase
VGSGVQVFDISMRLRAEAVLPHVHVPRGATLADLGCGTGWFSAELERRGYEVVCVDASQPNLDELGRTYRDAVRRGSLVPMHGDVTALPLESSSLDGAVCMEVLEHVREDTLALQEINRVLIPEAPLIVTVPNADAPPPLLERLGLESVHDLPGPEQHVRPGYRADDLTAKLSDAGFRVTFVGGVGGALFRATTGLVSLAHLVYRRTRGQKSWTWADVERDASALPLRMYSVVFPALLSLSRLERGKDRASQSSLVVVATKVQ